MLQNLSKQDIKKYIKLATKEIKEWSSFLKQMEKNLKALNKTK